jgi:putative transposase
LGENNAAGVEKKFEQGWTVIFGDETGSTLESSVTHTWGLRGQTPVMSAQSKRTRLNVVGGISWAGEIFAQATTDSMNKLGFKAFLESVLARVSGNVVMVLDNSRIHQNAEIVKFVEENERLEIVFLPAYAPELNPIELLWAWVKGHWLANLVLLSVDELRGLWREALWVVGHTPGLVKGFFGRLEKILEENLKLVSM